jgi:ribosome assembly protein RRB1
MYMVAGTQADNPSKNKIMFMKLSQLHKTRHDGRSPKFCFVLAFSQQYIVLSVDDSDFEEDDDDVLDDDPILEHRHVPHPGGVNRIRVSLL